MSVGGCRLFAWQDLKIQKKEGSRSLESLTFQRSYASLLPVSPPFCSSCYLFYLFLSLHFSWLYLKCWGQMLTFTNPPSPQTESTLPLPAPRLHPVCGINSASLRTPYLPQTAVSGSVLQLPALSAPPVSRSGHLRSWGRIPQLLAANLLLYRPTHPWDLAKTAKGTQGYGSCLCILSPEE